MHIDHIIPLAAGGDNEPDNLQALCKKCHFVRTKEEKENHEYIKLSSTESSFNSHVKEIMDSKLSQSYAFVETLSGKKYIHVDERRTIDDDGNEIIKYYDVLMVEQVEDNKVYTLDINKCRKNQMVYSEYDYPLVTVADEPQVYKINTKKKPGLYYIVSTSYFPFEGLDGIRKQWLNTVSRIILYRRKTSSLLFFQVYLFLKDISINSSFFL